MIDLGINLDTGNSLALPKSMFNTHAVLRGMTRSGKTLLLAKLLCSYLEQGSPLLVIDLAGDLYLWNTIREACSDLGRSFQTVSMDSAEETRLFNPLQGFDTTGVDVVRNAVTLVGGLGLDYGAGYGRGFFSAQNLEMALRAFERLSSPNRPPFQLEELSDTVTRMANRKRGEPTELSLALRLLSSYSKLDTDGAIGMNIAEGIEQNSVMYFFLDTLFQGPVRSVGTFAAFSAIMAMMRRKREGGDDRRLLIAIDEFASVARVPGFTDAIPQMVKFGASFLLVHQSESQLIVNGDRSLSDIVLENCHTRVYLTSIGIDEVNLQRESGIKTETQQSRTESGFFSSSVTERDIEAFDLSINRIKEISSTAFQGFLMQRDGKGFQNPIPFQFPPPPLSEHTRLASLAIPRQQNAQVTVQRGNRVDEAWARRIQEAIEQAKRLEDWRNFPNA